MRINVQLFVQFADFKISINLNFNTVIIVRVFAQA